MFNEKEKLFKIGSIINDSFDGYGWLVHIGNKLSPLIRLCLFGIIMGTN
jgi:hypothetical protein